MRADHFSKRKKLYSLICKWYSFWGFLYFPFKLQTIVRHISSMAWGELVERLWWTWRQHCQVQFCYIFGIWGKKPTKQGTKTNAKIYGWFVFQLQQKWLSKMRGQTLLERWPELTLQLCVGAEAPQPWDEILQECRPLQSLRDPAQAQQLCLPLVLPLLPFPKK